MRHIDSQIDAGYYQGMETRVTYRTSEETIERLRELAQKYGISQSALLTMLVNERWLAENAPQKTSAIMSSAPVGMDPEPPPNFPDEYIQPVSGKKKKRRRRH